MKTKVSLEIEWMGGSVNELENLILEASNKASQELFLKALKQWEEYVLLSKERINNEWDEYWKSKGLFKI